MIKNQDVREAYENLKHLSLSELHSESLRIANRYIEQFPDSWKDELKKNTKHKEIKILINETKKIEGKINDAYDMLKELEYWTSELRDQMGCIDDELDKLDSSGLDTRDMVNKMKFDFLKENWHNITLEQLESLVK